MSRRGAAHSESLDLLLDTVCNTFGSIVFLALLVVVLVRHHSREAPARDIPPDQVAQSRLVQLRIDHQELQQRLQRLRQVAGRAPLRVPESKQQLLARLKRLRRQRQQLARNKHHSLDSLARAQKEHNDLVTRARDLDRELKRVRQALRQGTEQLRRLQKENQRTARLPRLQHTQKREAAFILTGGNLYAIHRPGRHNNVRYETALKPSDECQIVTQGGQKRIIPQPGKGLPIPLKGKLDAVRGKLQRFNPQTDYLTVFVRTDSFAHWHRLHQVIEELGFQYALVPMQKDEHVTYGRGSRRLVQ